MDKVRVGYIGFGWVADWHLKATRKHAPEVDVVGACMAPELFDACKKKCAENQIKPYQSWKDIIADKNIDAVCIFTPTTLHLEQVLAAAAAGKHSLVEKPVDITDEGIVKMIEAANKHKVVVFPAHNFVYRPVVRKAREIIDSGALGTISYASFRAVHFIPEEHANGWRKGLKASGGGAMLDSGTHLVYQSIYLAGKPKVLSAFSAKRHYLQIEAEDICQIGLQYPDGTIGNIMQSWASGDATGGEVRIEGDKGSLLISDALYHDGKKVETDGEYADSFGHLAKAFAASIMHGTKPVSTLEDARLALRIIQQAYQSAAKGTTIKL